MTVSNLALMGRRSPKLEFGIEPYRAALEDLGGFRV